MSNFEELFSFTVEEATAAAAATAGDRAWRECFESNQKVF